MKTTRRAFIKGLFAAGVVTAVPLSSFEKKRPDILVCDDPGCSKTRAAVKEWWENGPRTKEERIEDIHVDKTLTDISVSYLRCSEGFIADKVFPIVKPKPQEYFVKVKSESQGYFFTSCVA